MTRSETLPLLATRYPLGDLDLALRGFWRGALRRHLVADLGWPPEVVSHGLAVLREQGLAFYAYYPTGWHHTVNTLPRNTSERGNKPHTYAVHACGFVGPLPDAGAVRPSGVRG